MKSMYGVAGLLLLLSVALPVRAENRATSETIVVAAPKTSSGRLGYGLKDLQTGQTFGYQADQRFPMQSVFKAMVGARVLQEVDAGHLALDKQIKVTRGDLAMEWSPIARDFGNTTRTFTVKELLVAAVGNSDNTAADKLMSMVGGPEAVQTMLVKAGIDGVRVDRYEREFQPELLGLPPIEQGVIIDQKEYEQAAAAVDPGVQQRAFYSYISSRDPRDTATPLGALEFLEQLVTGKLLSDRGTSELLTIMTESPSGAQRLKGSLPPGATFAHKTGTGGEVQGANAGTNDIGTITLADGRKYLIACFLAGSREPADERERIHREVARRLLEAAEHHASRAKD